MDTADPGAADPAALRRSAGTLLAEWRLRADGAARSRRGALVLPVTGADGPADLEVRAPGAPGRHAHLALRHWAGRGAVRLLRADPRRRALLLERSPATDLTDGWDVEACEETAALYAVLHVPAPPSVPTLSAWVAARADELEALPRDAPVPHRLVAQAAGLARGLAADEATDGTLLHGDLGYDAVVATGRGHLVVDPAPLSGDPHAEAYPLLAGRWEEVAASHSARDRVRLRFHTVVDAAGLDEDRARDWVVVRSLAVAHAALGDAAGGPVRGGGGQREVVTRAVTLAKAVQD